MLNHADGMMSIYGQSVTPPHIFYSRCYSNVDLLEIWRNMISRWWLHGLIFLWVVVLRDLSDLGHLSRNILLALCETHPSLQLHRYCFYSG